VFISTLIKHFKDRCRTLTETEALKMPLIEGPSREALAALLARTNYEVDVTVGQRKYGGPPPGWDAATMKKPTHEVGGVRYLHHFSCSVLCVTRACYVLRGRTRAYL
jgi:hypothetical protein